MQVEVVAEGAPPDQQRLIFEGEQLDVEQEGKDTVHVGMLYDAPRSVHRAKEPIHAERLYDVPLSVQDLAVEVSREGNSPDKQRVVLEGAQLDEEQAQRGEEAVFKHMHTASYLCAGASVLEAVKHSAVCVQVDEATAEGTQPDQQLLIIEGEQLSVEQGLAVQVPAAQTATGDMFGEASMPEAVKQGPVKQGVSMAKPGGGTAFHFGEASMLEAFKQDLCEAGLGTHAGRPRSAGHARGGPGDGQAARQAAPRL